MNDINNGMLIENPKQPQNNIESKTNRTISNITYGANGILVGLISLILLIVGVVIIACENSGDLNPSNVTGMLFIFMNSFLLMTTIYVITVFIMTLINLIKNDFKRNLVVFILVITALALGLVVIATTIAGIICNGILWIAFLSAIFGFGISAINLFLFTTWYLNTKIKNPKITKKVKKTKTLVSTNETNDATTAANSSSEATVSTNEPNVVSDTPTTKTKKQKPIKVKKQKAPKVKKEKTPKVKKEKPPKIKKEKAPKVKKEKTPKVKQPKPSKADKKSKTQNSSSNILEVINYDHLIDDQPRNANDCATKK